MRWSIRPVAMAAAVVTLAGCTIGPGPVQVVGQAPDTSPGALDEVSDDDAPASPTVLVYLVGPEGELVPTPRPATEAADPVTRAIAALVAPPAPEELEARLRNRVPRGTAVVATGIEDTRRWVDLTPEFDAGGTVRTRTEAIRQVVCTLADHDQEGRPSAVELRVEGRVLAREAPTDCD